jgi:hypothetical protein
MIFHAFLGFSEELIEKLKSKFKENAMTSFVSEEIISRNKLIDFEYQFSSTFIICKHFLFSF